MIKTNYSGSFSLNCGLAILILPFSIASSVHPSSVHHTLRDLLLNKRKYQERTWGWRKKIRKYNKSKSSMKSKLVTPIPTFIPITDPGRSGWRIGSPQRFIFFWCNHYNANSWNANSSLFTYMFTLNKSKQIHPCNESGKPSEISSNQLRQTSHDNPYNHLHQTNYWCALTPGSPMMKTLNLFFRRFVIN